MRKLTVKNFSVIKEAELEFGKITVLIGPQSSGKSLLCKLAYFFQQIVVEQAEAAIRASDNLTDFNFRLYSELLRWFGQFEVESQTTELSYSDGDYALHFRHKKPNKVKTEFDFGLSEGIESCYRTVRRQLKNKSSREPDLVDAGFYSRRIREELIALRSSGTPEVYSYIPSSRSFFVTVQKAVLAASNRIDPLAIRFSQDFSYDFERRVPPFKTKYELRRWINDESRRILKGEVVASGNTEVFVAEDGRELPLSYLSSGTQELLPLLTCLREFVAVSNAVATTLEMKRAIHKRLFFVEEPEANIFPSSQYDLVRIFVRMANEPELDASLVITTHSPYLLSSFNNLIEAGQVVRDHPELHAEVAKIVPERYWIKDGDFKAYSIHDGKLESILNESGFIEGNYLDQVSDVIEKEFDQLLRLEYDHSEAS